MKATRFRWAVPLLFFFVYHVSATEPDAKLLPPTANVEAIQKDGPKQPEKEQGKDKDKEKDKLVPDKKVVEPPPTDLFTRAPTPVSDALGFSPQMLGDFIGSFSRITVPVFGTKTTTTTTSFSSTTERAPTVTTTTTPTTQTRTILVPDISHGDFKVADNASPMPIDRVFVTYDYFGDVQGPAQGPTGPSQSTQTSSHTSPGGAGATSHVTTSVGATPQFNANVEREVFGFEKTFLDGRASVEVRIPLIQDQSNLGGLSSDDLSDLTIIGKYAVYLDRAAGNVFSVGCAVTAPTGPANTTIDGNFHDVLLQPWFGYVWNFDRFYVQAFHSVVVPTDARDITLLFNDAGLYYWLYRGAPDRMLSFIVPMIEAHVTTPLDHRSADAAFYTPDLVVLTGGVHFGLFRDSTLSLGVATPVSGPRLYNVEAFVQFNRRF